MLSARLLRSVFILLAAAACTNAGLPETQTAVGGSASSRPKMVIVNSFTYPSEVSGVDRELASRIQSKFGNMDYDVVKSLAAKRVGDEIVATTVVMVHAVGLNARCGNEGEPTPSNGALVINGRLRTSSHVNRDQPVSFAAGDNIVADITVSEVSEGNEKQVFDFTTSPQSGPELNTPALNAAINKMLAAKSAADVSLPPKVEVLARGLGRAVATRVVTYARERGWITEADLPAPLEEAKPENKKREKRPQATINQDSPVARGFPCEAFTKKASGNWYVRGPITIDVGSAKGRTLQDAEISPKFFTIGGADLYETVEKACGNVSARR